MAPAATRPALGTRWLTLVVALGACRSDPPFDSLTLVLPERGARPVTLDVRSAFAEYVDLPELRHELRLTFASYPLSCDRFVPPAGSDLALMLTIALPPDAPPKPGTIPALAPTAPAADDADAGTPATTRPSILAVVRREGRSFVLPPGGALSLIEVDTSPRGHVRGHLSLEFAGDADRAASTVSGKFSAAMCEPH